MLIHSLETFVHRQKNKIVTIKMITFESCK